MTNYFGPQEFGYAAFVSEVETLIERGRNLDKRSRDRDAPAFRAWRLELEDLLNRIRRLKYSVNVNVEARLFRTNGTETLVGRQAHFDRDYEDTEAELRLVVSNFKKYGDPKRKTPSPAPRQTPAVPPSPQEQHKAEAAQDTTASSLPGPKPPEKVTLIWILHNVPVMMLVGAVTAFLLALATAFSLGMAAAGTKAGQAVLDWVTPTKAQSTASPASGVNLTTHAR